MKFKPNDGKFFRKEEVMKRVSIILIVAALSCGMLAHAAMAQQSCWVSFSVPMDSGYANGWWTGLVVMNLDNDNDRDVNILVREEDGDYSFEATVNIDAHELYVNMTQAMLSNTLWTIDGDSGSGVLGDSRCIVLIYEDGMTTDNIAVASFSGDTSSDLFSSMVFKACQTDPMGAQQGHIYSAWASSGWDTYDVVFILPLWGNGDSTWGDSVSGLTYTVYESDGDVGECSPTYYYGVNVHEPYNEYAFTKTEGAGTLGDATAARLTVTMDAAGSGTFYIFGWLVDTTNGRSATLPGYSCAQQK